MKDGCNGKRDRKSNTTKPNGHATRLATPFTIRCLSCGAYIYKNKRHNAIKETAVGKDYLGIESYRFYIKCTGCKEFLTIRTDPKNGEYIAENGCAGVTENDVSSGQDGECSISNQLRKESGMKDEIERLRMQADRVNSTNLSTRRPERELQEEKDQKDSSKQK